MAILTRKLLHSNFSVGGPKQLGSYFFSILLRRANRRAKFVTNRPMKVRKSGNEQSSVHSAGCSAIVKAAVVCSSGSRWRAE